jgi:hypothetical protein
VIGGRVKKGEIRVMYFIYLYENRTTKFFGIILNTGEESEGE